MKKLIPIAAATALLLTACGTGNYAATEIPAAPQPTTSSAAPAPAESCDKTKELASYAPDGPLPAPMQMPAGTTMERIQKRGRLIAGVSADSLHLGSRNPITGQIEGFDIDMINAVADAIFGPPAKGQPHKVEFRVISSPQRIPVLQQNLVDIVARNITINCARWNQIAFSAEYYRSGQKTLVQLDSKATKLADLSGQTICAPAGSTSLDNLKKANPKIKPVTADSDTGCLVLFQQGKAAGISGDDTVLAGDAAQDPYAKVLTERISDEPYGLGINKNNTDFVKFVNGVLEKIKTDGTWMGSYNKWLMPDLGKLPAPPVAVYGR
ncbi:glutamate ABC transporter substrate-binding protein [Kribbella solani]|uniref:glutamate ABC transporter substrate-binding protein n=1 Tax=Kribbella solani TaxID=236067 RepID=UPI0029B08538|nr:glutamate ABC transporter substrate-binding protein [Kribbella solani]MDX2973363.1 glutamate ABC transporter substrate-binding protein [Kribbella solani]MDX3000644.1 glutamate ABC transporter substrate-binding protein [Kribbella solani]